MIDERIGWLEKVQRAENLATKAELKAHFSESLGAFREELHLDRRTAQRQLLFIIVVAFVSLLVTVAVG